MQVLLSGGEQQVSEGWRETRGQDLKHRDKMLSTEMKQRQENVA